MKTSLAKDIDIENVKKLWQYSFADDDSYVEYYFNKRYKKENNLILKEDGQILSSLQLNPYTLKLGKCTENISYIVGISSFPENRGRGYTSKLIKNTLNYLYEKGMSFSILMPIDTKIYTRYGFSNICDMGKITIPLNRINIVKENDSKIIRYRSKENISDLIKIYQSISKSWKCNIIRDVSYYENYIKEVELEGGVIFIEYQNNIPNSYMTFYPKYKDATGYVREFLSLNTRGINSLLNIMKQHYTQIKNVEIDLPLNSHIPYVFDFDNMISYEKKPFMMGRIINVEKILSECVKNKNIENLNIQIIDNLIDKNNMIFTINKNNLSLLNDNRIDLSIDISDLTLLVTGYISVEEYIWKNEIQIDDTTKNKLNLIFEKGINYFNDYV